jgi:Leucine-rich repeat (LRR) protein
MTRLTATMATLSIAALLYSGCTDMGPVAGGTTNTDNARVMASISYPDGTPATKALVRIREASYVATNRSDTMGVIRRDTLTDSLGFFVFEALDTGDMVIEVLDSVRGYGLALSHTITGQNGEMHFGERILQKTGSLLGTLDSGATPVSVSVKGLERSARADGGRFRIKHLPHGSFTVAIKDETDGAAAELNDIPVSTGATTVLRNVSVENPRSVIVEPGTFAHDSLLLVTFMEEQGLDISLFPQIGGIDSSANRIRTIRLENLGIETLHPSISTLKFAWHISLDNNPLSQIPPQLSDLSGLGGLSLNGVALDSLPEHIGRLQSLRWLKLDSTGLTDLPEALAEMPLLASLSIKGNGMVSLPGVIFQIDRLGHLSADDNFITSIPPEIGNLKNLELLALANNRVTSVAPGIGECGKLRDLYLYNNRIATLPPEIGQLSRLSILQIEENSLQTLPEDLGNCTALSHLYLGGNALTGLPTGLAALKPQVVRVYGNSLCPENLSQAIIDWLDTYSSERSDTHSGPIWRSLQEGCL